jgi:hypothetical protein
MRRSGWTGAAAALATVALAAFAVAGCGGGSSDDEAASAAAGDRSAEGVDRDGNPLPGTPEAEIMSRFGTFRDYLEIGSAHGACARLSRSFRGRLGGVEACERHVEGILESRRFPVGQRRDVLDVDVRGDRATATVRVGRGETNAIPFVRDPEGWNIAGGSPW